MYPRIVRQTAFIGRGALGVIVLISALCKFIDRLLAWQSIYIERQVAPPLSPDFLEKKSPGAPFKPDFGLSGDFLIRLLTAFSP
jgi:hypothetical protein